MDRYNSIDNTSPVLRSMQDEKPGIKRSAFDYTASTVGQLMLGAVIPIDLIRVVPNTSGEYAIDLNIISRNPLLRKILSTQRCYIHSYLQYDRNLWEGARNQKTNGYSGTINLQTPCIKLQNGKINTSNAFSLSSWLGVPPLFYDNSSPLTSYKAVDTSSLASVGSVGVHEVNKIASNETISALPFVMYQQICRDKLFNPNTLYENKNWFPDNEDHWILPYSVEADEETGLPFVNVLDYDNPCLSPEDFEALDFSADGKVYVPTNDNDGSSPVVLDSIHFRQRKGDRFTTALPFPDLIRGDIPYIDMRLVASSDDIIQEVTSSVTGSVNGSGLTIKGSFASTGQTNSSGPTKININSSLSDNIQVYGSSLPRDIVNALNNNYKASGTLSLQNGIGTGSFNVQELASKIVASSLSLNDIRTLQAYTIFKERNALAKGDYNSLIEAQFGYSPNVQERQPIYIGGFYQDILFSEVVQQSQSSDSSQLGQKASNAYSNSSGYIGKFHAKDFGYVMTVLSIVPDSFYTQGLSPHITATYQDEVYFPILNELPPEAILNKELFTTGDASIDNDVFAYTERFSEYKSRRNRVVGLSALGDLSLFDSALIQKNIFTDTVPFNNQFLTLSPKNIDMSIYSVEDEPPYDFFMKSRLDIVSPFPYTTLPKGVI